MTVPAWILDAACLDADPEEFFPPPSRRGTSIATIAKMICAECAVATECLTWQLAYEATSTGGRYGIYGGLTPEERGRLARRGVVA